MGDRTIKLLLLVAIAALFVKVACTTTPRDEAMSLTLFVHAEVAKPDGDCKSLRELIDKELKHDSSKGLGEYYYSIYCE